MKPFWILWHPEGINPPKVRFTTFASAQAEARRMMLTAIRSGSMYILRCVGEIKIQTLVSYVKPRSKKHN